MDSWLSEIAYGFRRLLRRPAFAAIGIGCLGLGIGANVAVFTVLSALDPELPGVREPSRLVSLWRSGGAEQLGSGLRSFSWPDYVDLEAAATTLELAAFAPAPITVAIDGASEQVAAGLVTGGYFATLGVEATAGRLLSDADNDPSAPASVAVISERLWRDRFGHEPEVIGREVLLNGQPFAIVGVARPGFRGTQALFRQDAWVPAAAYEVLFSASANLSGDSFSQRDLDWLYPFGRLRDAELATVRSEMAVIAERLEAAHGKSPDEIRIVIQGGIGLHPRDRDQFRGWSVFARPVAAAVLLIACVNVASLLMAEARGRRREIAIRAAIGCSRARLVRQLCLEHTSLVISGGAFAWGALAWGRGLLPRLVPYFPAEIAAGIDFSPDGRSLVFAAAVCLAALPVFALGPAMRASGSSPLSGLNEAGRTGRARSLTRGLVVLQVALAVALLTVAGLFVRSIQAFWDGDPGFEPNGLLLARLDASAAGLDSGVATQLYRNLQNRLAALPDVEFVSLGINGPHGGGFLASPHRPVDESISVEAMLSLVTEDYFHAAGIPMVRGRDVSWGEMSDGRLSAVINQTLARRLWPDDEDPLGDTIVVPGHPYLGTEDRVAEVIGIVAERGALSAGAPPAPMLWVPYALAPESLEVWPPTIHIRVDGDPGAVALMLRGIVSEQIREVAVAWVMDGTEWQSQAATERRQAAVFAGGYALLALGLAALGVYGTIAHAVSERTSELGVRTAVGAREAQIVRLVISEGLGVTLLGGAIGAGIGLGVAGLVRSHIHGVAPYDPVTLIAVAGLITAVASAACTLPARRAARTDPLITLRAE